MSFEPVYAPDARVLLLGSWPSPKSWQAAFYYGHPQNRFWPLMAAITGSPVPALEDIEAKKALIRQNGLALWDVLESCTITGASDASIRNPVFNDLQGLCQELPIQAVFCAGAAAHGLYQRYARQHTVPPAVRLPSTSPANAAWSLERLVEEWGRALAPWL